MEVKKYRYNDMTERYRRMNRFYIIATVVLGGSFIVYLWLKMVMSSISAMTVYSNTVVMAAFTIANTVIYMRNRATKQLKIIATYEVGIEFLLVGVQSDAHFISFAIIAIFLLQIPYFDKKGLTKTAVGMAVLYAIVTAVQIKKGIFVMNVSGFCEIILTVFIGIAILNVGKIIIAFNDDAMGATKEEQNNLQSFLNKVMDISKSVNADTAKSTELMDELLESTQSVAGSMKDITAATNNTAASIQEQNNMTSVINAVTHGIGAGLIQHCCCELRFQSVFEGYTFDKLQIYFQLRWHPLSRLGDPIKVIKKMKQTDNFKFAEFDQNKTSS